jgi:hypothetical protein
MPWIKKGLIYTSTGKLKWDFSHAQVPTPILLSSSVLRIFYSSRNANNQSHISFIDVNADNPSDVVYIHPQPLLQLGTPGAFDDSGMMPSWIVYTAGEFRLYYIGWNVRNTVPYYNSVGMLTSTDCINFSRFSNGPLWDRDYREPFFSASSCVIFHNGVWKNWYLSCTGYFLFNGKQEPRYHIKYAESGNGIDWVRNGVIALDYKTEQEAGIVKASVMVDEDCFKMWFSYRNFENYRTDRENSYKIGYAESQDGIKWKRFEAPCVELSSNGWDSEMMAYPHVIDVNKSRLMFYNGNGFGKTGFGYATFDQS